MGGVTLTGPHGQVFEPRKLRIPELESYIRRGCSCCVCEYARSEIRARQKESIEVRHEESAAGAIGLRER